MLATISKVERVLSMLTYGGMLNNGHQTESLPDRHYGKRSQSQSSEALPCIHGQESMNSLMELDLLNSSQLLLAQVLESHNSLEKFFGTCLRPQTDV